MLALARTVAGAVAGQGSYSPYILARGGIPFIGLSSGSVSAAGAISGITALPFAYAAAYCWFPANALATAIAANWHYCTFSTTSAGTAFLNTYAANQTAAGEARIPSSPTAVTDGKGAFTGDTGEEFGPTLVVPANSIGPSGRMNIRAYVEFTNSAGVKTPRVRFSGNGGTVYYTQGPTTTLELPIDLLIANAEGQTNKQVGYPSSGAAWNAASANASSVSAVDTTAASSLVLSLQRNTATDNVILRDYLIELLYGA